MPEARMMYNSFLESGELNEFIPKACGDWEKDEKLFMRYYDNQQRILKDIGFEGDYL